MQKHEKKQSPYRIETARNLARADIATEPIEYDVLHVTLGGKRLFWVSGSGCVGHYREDVTSENSRAVLDQVHDIARMTCEYMTLMEQAPSLSASGLDLEEGYRALAEFNNVVLAGKMTHYGAQFVTWEWVRERTGLYQGNYYGPSGGVREYAAAKRDFALRSGLLPASALFTQDQLTEVYRSIHETLDGDGPLTDKRRKVLETAAGQIEEEVPDLAERVSLSCLEERELAHKLDGMDVPGKGGMDHATSTNCKISRLDSGYSVLAPLKDALVNVDQLDYLAKRLDSFDEGEAAQFQAMAHKLSVRNIKDFINLTFCYQRATVITDFNDLEQAGRDHRMNLSSGVLTAEEAKGLDGRKAALQLIYGGEGTITPFGVVYDNGMRMERLYDGKHFPAYLYDAYPLVLEASSRQAPEEGTEYLYLPASQRQIERTLCRAGITSGADLQLRIWFHQMPEQTAFVLNLEHLTGADLPALNRMCRAIKPLASQDRKKLEAAVWMAMPHGADEVCRLAENLEQFTFVPGIQSPNDYGEYLIKESGEFCYDEKLEGLYDYLQCGLQRVQEENGQFHPLGYIAYHGTLALDELLREDPAEQYQREQGRQMGGLSC